MSLGRYTSDRRTGSGASPLALHTPTARGVGAFCEQNADPRVPNTCRHAACLYGLLASRPDLNILGGLSPSEWRDVRRMIVGAVLQTDMTHHFPMVSKVGTTVSAGAARGRTRRGQSSRPRTLTLG